MTENDSKAIADMINEGTKEIVGDFTSRVKPLGDLTLSQEDSRIRLCDEGVEVLKDTEKLYIDKPEQIDVYRDCKAIVEAVDRLNRKVAAYGMTSTTGGRAVLMFAPDGSICLNPYNIADCYTGNFFQRYNGTEIKTENVTENAKSGH